MTRDRHLLWTTWLLALTLPLALIGFNLRVVSGHWFVRWEYGREGFPADPFGLSDEERIRLATVCQDFLSSHADISLLADLELADGQPAFNPRELRHMADVQAVYQGLSIAGLVGSLLWAVAVGAWIGAGRGGGWLPTALLRGSVFTLGLLAVVGAFMGVSWGRFFTAFHQLFFEGETWVFPMSDTLIRLFPMRFWIDVAVLLVGLLVIEAMALGLVGRAMKSAGLGRSD